MENKNNSSKTKYNKKHQKKNSRSGSSETNETFKTFDHNFQQYKDNSGQRNKNKKSKRRVQFNEDKNTFSRHDSREYKYKYNGENQYSFTNESYDTNFDSTNDHPNYSRMYGKGQDYDYEINSTRDSDRFKQLPKKGKKNFAPKSILKNNKDSFQSGIEDFSDNRLQKVNEGEDYSDCWKDQTIDSISPTEEDIVEKILNKNKTYSIPSDSINNIKSMEKSFRTDFQYENMESAPCFNNDQIIKKEADVEEINYFNKKIKNTSWKTVKPKIVGGEYKYDERKPTLLEPINIFKNDDHVLDSLKYPLSSVYINHKTQFFYNSFEEIKASSCNIAANNLTIQGNLSSKAGEKFKEKNKNILSHPIMFNYLDFSQSFKDSRYVLQSQRNTDKLFNRRLFNLLNHKWS